MREVELHIPGTVAALKGRPKIAWRGGKGGRREEKDNKRRKDGGSRCGGRCLPRAMTSPTAESWERMD